MIIGGVNVLMAGGITRLLAAGTILTHAPYYRRGISELPRPVRTIRIIDSSSLLVLTV